MSSPTFAENNRKMSAFTLYIDDSTKLAVQQRLSMLVPDANKGAIAALIRVLLREFITLPFDDKSLDAYKEAIEKEYLYTTKKNKRSKL